MEDKHKELLEFHRGRFVRAVDPDRLTAALKGSEVLDDDDLISINNQPSNGAKVEKILDILPCKGTYAFQSLCHALELTYPHLLTLMFLGGTNKNVNKDSNVASHTDLQENGHRRAPSTDNVSLSNPAPKTYTKLIPAYKYELNNPNPLQSPCSTEKSNLIIHSSHNATSASNTDKGSHDCHPVKSKHTDFHYPAKINVPQPNKEYRLSLNGDNRVLERQRDYELLKMQYERAVNELQSIKQKHVDTIKDVDTYRTSYVSGRSHVSQKCSNIDSFKNPNLSMNPPVERIEFNDKSDILDMRNKLQQHSELISERGSTEVISKMSENSIRAKYEMLKKDYDILHQRHTDLLNQHAVTCNDLQKVSMEIGQTQKSYNEALSDRDNALTERNSLQQQCTSALRKWDASIHEMNSLKVALDQLTLQREKQKKESQQTVAVNMQMKKDLESVSRERDAALREYALIMSERDTVHKEIEQQQEKIADATKRLEVVENEKKTLDSKVKKLQSHAAELLEDRDKSVKDYTELYQKYSDLVAKQEHGNSRGEFCPDYSLLTREHRDFSQCQQLTEHDLILRDSYEQMQMEKTEEINQGVREIDTLKKHVEKIQHELNDALQEAELSKKRRDWAFDERNKIVQERESIKNLCDSLRRDRDRAVSDLAQALRDSDELKKQKNEACREFKELKEKYDILLEKDTRKNQLNSVGHNHSRDSAIDADMLEWETETLQIDITGLDHNHLGFELIGGIDGPQFPNDSSIIISHISKGSAVEGKLKVNDVVVRINDIDVTNVERKVPLEAIFNATGLINMVVRRRRSTTRLWQPLRLNLSSLKGVQIENGLFISRISTDSAMTKEGMLVIGDRINNINGQTVNCKMASEVMKMLQNCEETVILDIWRQTISPANSTGSSPTPICQTGIRSLHEQSVISAAVSDRSCNEADKDHLSDSGLEESKDSKTVRHNGSQTDSLDSPRPLHRKNKSSNQKESENRSRNSTSDKFLEKAREFLKINRPGKYSDRPERNAFQAEEDKVIAEFNAVISSHDDYPIEPKKELYHENSGTWPKVRSMQTNTSKQGTVISTSSQKRKDRPPLSAILTLTDSSVHASLSSASPLLEAVHYNKTPLLPSERTNSSYAAPLQHSPQNSGLIFHSQSPNNQPLKSNTISSLNQPLAKSVPLTSTKDHVQIKLTEGGTLPHHGVSRYPLPSTLERTVGDGYSKGMRPKLGTNKYERRFHQPQPGIHQIPVPQMNPANSTNSNASNSSEPHSFRVPQTAWPFPTSFSPSISSTADSMPVNKYRLPTVGTAAPSARPLPNSSHSLPSHMTSVLRQPSQVRLYQMGNQQRVPPQGQAVCSSSSLTPVSSQLQSLSPRHNSPSYMTSSIPEMEPDSTPYHLCKEFQTTLSPPFMHPKEMAAQRPNPMAVHRPGPGTNSIMKHPRNTLQSVKNVEKWLSNISTSSNTVDRGTPTLSEDFPYNRLHPRHPLHSSRDVQELNGCSTFPKHGHDRIRIPSNTSVATKSSAGRISTSSAEVVSERSSPMSPIIFPIERTSTPSMLIPPPNLWVKLKPGKTPNIGDTRHINIEMTSEPVGFKIDSATEGGIFVSSVSENSLASEHGLFVGDQLLEVCGINMRIATYELAASVLRQCRESLTMLVQYNFSKYQEEISKRASSSSPPNCPDSPSKPSHHVSNEALVAPTLSPGNLQLHRLSTISSPETMHVSSNNQHCIILDKPKSTSSLGLSLIGGQGGIGVFVEDVRSNSLADRVDGLSRGFQILECNGMDLRFATVEQARNELSKPTSSVKIISQYNPDSYLKCRFSSGGPFFLRSLFDYQPTDGDLSDLSFKRNDVLFVNDVCRGGLVTEKDENGHSSWFAYLLNSQGKKLKYGRIPTKLSPSFDLKRSSSESLSLQDDELKYSRRGSGTVRRSFFKRKKHQRTNSRDSRDLSSFSEISLTADSLCMSEDGLFCGFTKVERKECNSIRPVILLAPLSQPLINKLTAESPDKYSKIDCKNFSSLEKSQTDNAFLEYQKRDDLYDSIMQICDNDCHCLLNVHPSTIDRLHRLQLYPIVIFVRHKNSKQIRETKDVTFLPEKISNRNAKELFEQFQKIEQEYRHYISAYIPGGNLAEMCMQIKCAIAAEQKKVVFIPCSSTF